MKEQTYTLNAPSELHKFEVHNLIKLEQLINRTKVTSRDGHKAVVITMKDQTK